MCARVHAALSLASCTVHLVGNNLDHFKYEHGPSCIGLDVCLCGHVKIMSICRWAGVLLLACMQAPRLPGPIHSSFISWRVGGIISTDAFSVKRLSTKLTLVKQFEKMTWRRGRETEIPGRVDKQLSDDSEAQGPVCLRVSDDYLADREPRFKHTAWEHPRHLQHTHPIRNFPSAATLSTTTAKSASTATAMPASLKLT